MLCVATFISSCTKDESTVLKPTSSPGTATSQSTSRKAGKPFTGEINYSFNAGFNMPCDCGPYYPVGTFSGSGNLSHLGLSTSDIKPCVSPVFNSDGTQTGDHVGIECAYFVAANGDRLYCYTHPYDLVYTPTAAIGHVTVDFVGGTGRFTSATGSFTGVVTVPYGTGTASLTNIDGIINY